MSPRPTSRLGEITTNLQLTARTVAQHVTDDPVVFWLQVSRRLPRRWVAPLARLAYHTRGVRLLPVRATALHILGRDDDARALLRRALGDARGEGAAASSYRALRRGAEVALAMGDPELAETLLARLPAQQRGAAATHARLRWFHGDVDRAVAVLEEARLAGRTTRGEQDLERRLGAERELLGDFAPRLERVGDYRAEPRTVLYAVTNSLPHTASGYAQRSHSYLTALADEGWTVHAVTRPGYPVQVGKILARHEDTVDGITHHRILPARLAPTATGRVQQHAEALLELALQTGQRCCTPRATT